MKLATSIIFASFISAVLSQRCSSSTCKIEDNCRCSSTNNPISDSIDPAPQFIGLTVSESVVTTLYENYLRTILFDRKNPDGKPVSATFYVNHEYTDYHLVQDLYLRGYEIGVHSITKNYSQEYWREASLNDLIDEFGGQKIIISTFANIPAEDITGVRTPQLQLEGDLSIEAYVKSDLSYDNSWPTLSSKPLLPYTLDYQSTQECLVTIKCPAQSHKGFWVTPITDIKGKNNIECNSLAACLVDGSAEEIANWLIQQVDRVYKGNRAPLILRLDSYWFDYTEHSQKGFELFLDEMSKRSDVFFVGIQDIINWIKNPVPASKYSTPVHERSGDCLNLNCKLIGYDGRERYMKSCAPCPTRYPWKGNPLGL